MSSHNYLRRGALKTFFFSLITGVACVHAQAQNSTFGPDLIQTLGVGARAVGMGGAYTAIANDASATFWNPAQLSTIKRNQFDFEMRTVSQDIITRSGTSASPFSAFSVGERSPQVSFLGFAAPLTRVIYKKQALPKPEGQPNAKVEYKVVPEVQHIGVLGLSYSLGGYADLISNSTLLASSMIYPTVANTNNVETRVRNAFINISYGNSFNIARDRGVIRAGVGVFVVNQDYYQQQSSSVSTVAGQGAPLVPLSSSPSTSYQETGHGVGYQLGITYQAQRPGEAGAEAVPGPWIFSAAYRTGPGIGGLQNGNSFNSEIPDRLSLAVAYQSTLYAGNGGTTKKAGDKAAGKTNSGVPADDKARGKANQGAPAADKTRRSLASIIVSSEVQSLGPANDAQQLDYRHAVTDYHLGVEISPTYRGRTAEQIATPLRFGYHTISNANSTLFSYDEAYTLGFGIQRLYGGASGGGYSYSIEGATEFLTHSGLFQYTLSARIRF